MTRPLDWEREGADWPHRAASSFVKAGGIRWHVQQMGEQGPVLLMVHGTGASTHSWRLLLPLLAPHFRCVAFDLPGHAFSSAPPAAQLSLGGMAAAVAALVVRLGVTPSVVLGHSAGAAIGAWLCLHERLAPAALVSVNGAFMPLPGLAGLVFPPVARVMAATPLAARLFAWRASDRDAVRRLIADTGSVLDARGIELYARLVGNPAHADAALGMMARWNLVPLLDRLPKLKPGLHLVVGERDRAVSPAQSREIARRVPGAQLTVVPNAGHLAHEEDPSACAAAVLATVPRVSAGAAG
ncbi:MAG: alpha/beta fold hydrolase [Comamonadaceae bacterium]|nr:MAG: alpha/beta fold hydrolase [Comamonadaceae bacterium]